MTAKEKDLLDSSINRSYIIKGISLLVGTLIIICTSAMTFIFRELVEKLDTHIELQNNTNKQVLLIQRDVDDFKKFIDKQEPINTSITRSIDVIETKLALRDNTSTKKQDYGSRQ